MYDDDSDGEGKSRFLNNNIKKVGGGVKRVARGTRRMSLMAADNVKNVAVATTGKVKNVAVGAVGVGQGKKKKKKKKKKEKKEKRKKSRGRSESPKRSNNAKPPVTKPGGLRSLFSTKRWRSASPAVGRKKKNRAAESDDESALSPLPTFSPMDPAVAPPDPASMAYMGADGMGGGMIINGGVHASTVGGMNQPPYGNQKSNGDAIGVSMRSMSSAMKYQRTQDQAKIERENEVPIISLVLQSNHFLKYCDIAFDLVDTNGDEVVDETELYAGLLLIHLKLGSFLGPAACKPLSRARCSTMFQKFDTTSSGGLDKDEFRRVMMVLFGNVFARVVIQYTLTILVVPLIAKNVVEFLTWDMQSFWDYWTKPGRLRRMGQEFTLDDFVDWTITSYPSSRRTFFTKMYRVFRVGSDAFWETFPLTFMTVILGLVIAPVVLHYCDEFFQYAVEWNENRSKSSSKKR